MNHEPFNKVLEIDSTHKCLKMNNHSKAEPYILDVNSYGPTYINFESYNIR